MLNLGGGETLKRNRIFTVSKYPPLKLLITKGKNNNHAVKKPKQYLNQLIKISIT